jgi:hypothetical protein
LVRQVHKMLAERLEAAQDRIRALDRAPGGNDTGE